jgi:hypothetical protein
LPSKSHNIQDTYLIACPTFTFFGKWCYVPDTIVVSPTNNSRHSPQKTLMQPAVA